MKLLLFTLFIGLSFLGISQDLSDLKTIPLENEADFKKNENLLIKAVDYNFARSTDEDIENRLICSRFITRFAAGVPYITVSLGNPVLRLTEKNPDLLILFMGLWMKSSIQKSDYSTEEHKLNVYSQLGKYARKENGVKKTCSLRKLIRATKKDKVDRWLKRFEKNRK